MQLIESYFPTLSEQQKEQFGALATLYNEWNAKINVIQYEADKYEKHLLVKEKLDEKTLLLAEKTCKEARQNGISKEKLIASIETIWNNL